VIGLAHCHRCARVVPNGPQPGEGFAEGLTPYLRAADGVAMLRRIVEHFSSGELVFDGWSRAGVWLTQRSGPVKAAGTQLDWSVDDPHELEKAVPGVVFDSDWWFADPADIRRHYPWLYWQFMWGLFGITLIRRLGRGLRYHFGHPGT
jgi:O-methyltransferase involved in polyketide biosynthesis